MKKDVGVVVVLLLISIVILACHEAPVDPFQKTLDSIKSKIVSKQTEEEKAQIAAAIQEGIDAANREHELQLAQMEAADLYQDIQHTLNSIKRTGD